MAPNTFRSYSRALELFNQFRNIAQYEYTWPIPVEHIVSYIAYMYQQKLPHSTISCYIAGLGFYSKINNMEDNTQKFVIRKMLEGVKRTTKSQSDTRLPITKVLLGKILNIIPVVTKNNFELQLFRAVYSLAFYGFLRVGELTVGGKNNSNHVICIEDTKINSDHIEIIIKSSKTDQFGQGTTINISKQNEIENCPVDLLTQYLQQRPTYSGPLFCHFDGAPLTRYQFNAILKKCFSMLGIKDGNFKSHSFRIGRATTCAIEGMPDDQIKQLGRWKSDAYLRYIRI